jgi:hypothetical protein
VRILATLLLSVCCVVLPRPVAASTILFRTDAELIRLSERVVHARVVGQRATRDTGPNQRIYTVTTLAVIEDLTGREGDTVEVWELGGAIGGQILYVGGQVQFRAGDEVLVCLERGPRGLRSVAMGFSTFDVVRTAGAAAQLQRHVDNLQLVVGVLSARERSLAEFRALAATVLGRPSRVVPASSPTSSDAPLSATQPWTKLVGDPGWRWRDADFGVPIRVFKNTSAPPPLLTGDAVPEFETALAAWTNPPSASVILQYAGTALESNAVGSWSTIPEHSTLITFEDPDDDMPDNVLALGGGMASVGTGGMVGGVLYDGFDFGFVKFQRAAVLPVSFRQSLDFSRVLMHEIGHTIGFGHTQTDGSVVNPTSNIMYASCCAANTPTPPTLGPDDLIGLNVVYPAAPASGPTMALDKTAVRFGATTSAGALVAKTSAQVVRLSQSGAGTVTWTATASRPWLQVSPSSGTGPANLLLSVSSSAVLPASGIADGAVIFTFSGASNAPGPVAVRLTLIPAGQSADPFGVVETPINQTTGVTGAIPVTGWALDDVEVTGVMVCRAALMGETPSANAACGGMTQFVLGSGLFIEGARPDVQAAYPTYPLNGRAGWGFMVLTNMLPNQGNGTYQLFMYAGDREGRTALIGSRTITCDNAHATKPFGTLDTPTQGGTASGTSYVNFGWALTPLSKTIPIDGSTITVLVDGVSKGTADYNHFRSDVAALFPGLNNTNGAVGFKILDTTTLANGLHTISWVVSDNQGASEGIGSRFFNVSNGAGSLTEAAVETFAVTADALTAAALPLDRAPILVRRGWDLDAPLRAFALGASGRTVIRSEEVGRVELRLAGRYTGHLRVGDSLASLPVGSALDADTGVFTWTPGVGFVGAYDLVFARWTGGAPVSRQEVRIILAPKGSGLVGPQVVIDTPAWQQDVPQPFIVAGWAADLRAAAGTGVATLHAWAYPLAGGPPVFLGATAYGGARPDVAAVHGDEFRDSGFGLSIQGLIPGHYDLAIFAWSTEAGDFAAAKVVRITVR